MKSVLRFSFVVLALVLLLASCARATPTPAPATPRPATPAPATPTPVAATPTPAAKPAEFTLKWGTHYAPEWGVAGGTLWFQQEVQRRTDGRVKIDIGWAGAFGKGTEQLDLLIAGALDFTNVVGGYTPGRVPIREVLNEPLWLFRDIDEALAFYQQVIKKHPLWAEEAERAGFIPLWSIPLLEYIPIGNRRAERLSEFEGAKMRTFGVYFPLMIQGLGAVPVTVLPADWYESLRRGTTDFMVLHLELAYSNKLYEVAKYINTGASMGAFIGDTSAISKKTWDRLPPDIQTIMKQVADEAILKGVEKQKAFADTARKAFLDRGAEFLSMPEADKRLWKQRIGEDPLQVWAKDMEKKGMGSQAKTIIGLLADWGRKW